MFIAAPLATILQWYRRNPTPLLTAIFAVLFGFAFGSFLNVCIARLPRHQSIAHPGSRCPGCGTPILARDNIPLLSWILLRGRCRACHHPIPWRYPAVEFATAALFLLCDLRFGLTALGIGMAALCFLLLGLAVMDAETLRLPNAFTLPGIALGILWTGISLAFFQTMPPAFDLPGGAAIGFPSSSLKRHLDLLAIGFVASALWAFLAALVLLLISGTYYLVRRRQGLGTGDIKLIAMIAAWLGPALTLLTFVLAAFATALYAVILLAASPRKRETLAAKLPFGSFLCAAALYALFLGAPILTWYLHFFP